MEDGRDGCCAPVFSVLVRKEGIEMRYLVIALVALAFATSALAVQNPDIRIYLDVEPPGYVHEVHPAVGTTFVVYICFDCFGPGGGTRGTGVLFVRTFEGFKLSQLIVPPGLGFGDVEIDGWTFAFEQCAYPDASGVVVAALVEYLYMGTPGTLDIAPHPGTGRNTLDCNYQEDDQYCIYANLGVSMPPNPGEDCPCGPNPVEEATWGGIKSLYR
jgi:hypothetical protein